MSKVYIVISTVICLSEYNHSGSDSIAGVFNNRKSADKLVLKNIKEDTRLKKQAKEEGLGSLVYDVLGYKYTYEVQEHEVH